MTMMEWRLADAKNRFSEVINRALLEGPQRVLRRDDAVVIVSLREYDRLLGRNRSFKDFLLQTVPCLEELELVRNPSPMREVNSD